MRILFFAQARLATTLAEENWDPPSSMPEDQFWATLIGRHPSLAPLQPSCRLARNGRLLATGERLEPGDEVAVLPPVSGG